MKKVLLTAAILFAGTLGFYSCTEEEPAEPTPNVGTQNPDDQKEPEKEPIKEEGYSNEGIEDELDPVVTGPDRGSESFPASFFQKDENTGAIIDLGRSFHINYPYTNTEMCFTEGSRNQSMERKKEGNNTKVDIFYTSNDYEYNTLKTNEYSGGIGFMNTFQLDAKRLEQYTTSTSKNVERLVFIATVDYGQFYYAKPLVLTKEANAFLKAGKFDEFKTKYGTHYVMGCERYARIFVEIEKKVVVNKDNNSTSNSINASLNYKGWHPDFSWENNKENCTINKEDEIEVHAIIQGSTTINELDIEDAVKKAIKDGSSITTSVKDCLNEKLDKIKNLDDKDIESQSKISKYYVSSFAMKGCQGINWCTEKENTLSAINENHLNVKRLINMVKNFTSKNTADIIVSNLFDYNINNIVSVINNDYKSEYNQAIPEEFLSKMNSAYESANLVSDWKSLLSKAEALIPSLKSQYNQCSEISFDINNSSDDYTSQIEDLFDEYNSLYQKGNETLGNIWKIAGEAAQEMEARKATITLKNNSKYLFKVEIKGQDPVYISGGETININLWAGTYYLKAIQQNGYTFWATEVEKTINAEEGGAYTFSFTD